MIPQTAASARQKLLMVSLIQAVIVSTKRKMELLGSCVSARKNALLLAAWR